VRVTRDREELLLTRHFFAGDAALDRGATASGDVEPLLLALEPHTDEVGFALQYASRILRVDDG